MRFLFVLAAAVSFCTFNGVVQADDCVVVGSPEPIKPVPVSGRFCGRVSSTTGNVLVVVRARTGKARAVTRTDQRGDFMLPVLPNGRYRVYVPDWNVTDDIEISAASQTCRRREVIYLNLLPRCGFRGIGRPWKDSSDSSTVRGNGLPRQR
jgi:hypothetical protein